MKIRRLFINLLLFTFSFSIAGVGNSLQCSLQLGKALGRIPPYSITGFNFGNWMCVYDKVEQFSKIDIGILRFPAGNYGDEHDLTPVQLDFLKLQLTFLGNPKLIMQARLFGGVTGTGTPEDAVAAAHYAKKIGLDIRYWEIGNEPDLYATHRGDPTWTPEKYCREFRRFAEALRAYDPQIKLAGPAISQGGTPLGDVWIRTFIRECGDLVDLLTWHFYPTNGTWADTSALTTSSAVSEQIQRYRTWLKDPRLNPHGYDRDIGLGITEFGLSWNTNNFHHLTDMTAALWTADVLGQMAIDGLDVGMYFALQDTGGHGLIDTAGWERPTYWVFTLLRGFAGTAYATTSSLPKVHAYAALNGGKLHILLVNLSTVEVPVKIEWGGFVPQQKGNLVIINDNTCKSAVAVGTTRVDPGGTFAIPGRSVGMLIVNVKEVK